MKKIVHLAPDEKFMDYAYEAFSELKEVENKYFIFSSEKKTKHIHFDCEIGDYNSLNTKEFVTELNKSQLLIIHFLDINYYSLLANKKLTTKILWIGWGGDYYLFIDSLPAFQLYKPVTKKYVEKGYKALLPEQIKKALKKKTRLHRLKTINRIDYFAPVLYNDYKLIKQNYSDFLPRYIDWNYGNLEDNYIKNNENFLVTGNHILLGNSATPTNNHLDLLNLIQEISVDNKVIIPLNYGHENYAGYIGRKAEEKFKNAQINILYDFLPYEEYIDLIKSCGNIFMGHIRQQALGNIVTLLYFGAKIFFYKESVTYQFLNAHSIKVFTFDDVVQTPQILDKPLASEDISHTRTVLKQLWGKEAIARKTAAIKDLLY